MAQTNYTPISLYYSATATNVPVNTNLVAGELAINTNDGKLFYKDSSGVVQVLATKGGVGTSSTTQVLYNSSGLVVGSAGLTFDGTNFATTGTATATRFIPSGSTIATNGLYLPAANSIGISTNSTNAVYIDSSQNVGIGVTPSAWLSGTYKGFEVSSGGAGAQVNLVGGDASLGSNFYISAIGTQRYQASSIGSAKYQFYNGIHAWLNAPSGTAGNAITFTEAMRIDSSGNLLVGTSSGSIGQSGFIFNPNYTATGNSGVAIQHTNGSASGSVYASFVYNAGVIGSITQNGTTGVLYNLTSDYRLKDNPQPLTGASDFIMALQPKTWDWWDGSGKGVGFIAHEFMEVAKYSGNGEKDAVDAEGNPVYQSIQPSSSEVMANLVAMVQELKAEIDLLKGTK